MCLECSGKHRGLGVHISFVRSVTMDSWSEIQIKKIESGGNERLNNFLALYGISKETEVISKYNSNAASVYRDRIQVLAEGRGWKDPPVVKEVVVNKKQPPLQVRGMGAMVADGMIRITMMRLGHRGGTSQRLISGVMEVAVVLVVVGLRRSRSRRRIYTRGRSSRCQLRIQRVFSRRGWRRMSLSLRGFLLRKAGSMWGLDRVLVLLPEVINRVVVVMFSLLCLRDLEDCLLLLHLLRMLFRQKSWSSLQRSKKVV